MSPSTAPALVDLLGKVRAKIVDVLRSEPSTVSVLAGHLRLSEVAVRRHLQVLERDGLITAATVRRSGPGRPSSHYSLTDRARRLFPDNSSQLANELLDFLEDSHGRTELLRFLRWRGEAHADRYAQALPSGSVEERTRALALVLSAEGFDSSVTVVQAPEGATTLQLTQGHCAIKSVAEAHPELCAFEASTFRRLLGAKLSRRQTIASGADACVCSITTESTDRSQPMSVVGDHDGHQG